MFLLLKNIIFFHKYFSLVVSSSVFFGGELEILNIYFMVFKNFKFLILLLEFALVFGMI